jgi:galactan 5-O-arabinofuranosyltransferase
MEANQEVQLFPRTILQIQVTLTALTVLACVLAAERVAKAVAAWRRSSPEVAEALGSPQRFTAAGVLLAMVLAGGTIGSFFTNQYLPTPPADQLAGSLAWNSHQIRKPDGQCPKYANGGLCRDFPKTIEVNQNDFNQTTLVCEYPWHKQNALLALMKG